MNLGWAAFYFIVTLGFSGIVVCSRDNDVRWVGGLIVLGYILTVVVALGDWDNHWRFSFLYDAITAAVFIVQWKSGKDWILGVSALSILMVAAHFCLDNVAYPSALYTHLHDAVVNVFFLGQILLTSWMSLKPMRAIAA